MGRFKSTRTLVRQSFAILMQEKRLLFFPVVTSFLTVFIFLFFIAPIPFQPTGHSYLEQEHWEAVAESILRATFPGPSPRRLPQARHPDGPKRISSSTPGF